MVGLVCLTGVFVAPGAARAQVTNQAGLAGTVNDMTGASLPGVTVAARSPALIEQVRVVFTDGAGSYSIVSLPSGTYSVTFMLPGFNILVREGVVLQGRFVANVDAELPVGAVSETLTVSVASPVVDVVSTGRQTVLTAERIRMLPFATGLIGASSYVPGVGQSDSDAAGGPTVHGSDPNDGNTFVDGIKSGQQLGGRGTSAGGIGLMTQESAIAELTYDTDAQSAELAQSGVRMNLIPKDGGNQFSGDAFLSGSNDSFQSDNLSQALKDQGFMFAPTAYSWSIDGGAGGPIVQNTLWWFASLSGGDTKRFWFDRFWEEDGPSTPPGEAGEPGYQTFRSHMENVRITHQLTPGNKLTYSFQSHTLESSVFLAEFDFITQELSAGNSYTAAPTYLASVKWTASVTSRLLVEVGASYQRADLDFPAHENTLPDRVAMWDFATGRVKDAPFFSNIDETHRRNVRASVSYVTGSHSVMAGLNVINNVQYSQSPFNGDIATAFLAGGVGLSVSTTSGPSLSQRKMNCDCGLFVQDNWRMDRLTLNLGLRYDWFNNSIPGGTRPAGYFVPAIEFETVEDTPDWKDVNVRLGAAYDLSGNGKTALTASAGRYVANHALGITDPFNPLASQRDSRSWFDLDGNGRPLNVDGTPQFNEFGPSFNPAFGMPSTANQLDPDMPRGHNWEYSVGVQHELWSGVWVSASYYRRHFSDFSWVDNVDVGASNFEAFAFTGPVDPLLPNGEGEVVTVYGLDDGFAYSSGNLLTTLAPDDYRTYNGFEFIVDGPLRGGGFVLASVTTGQNETNFCTEGRDDPNALRFCNNDGPFRHQLKLSGAVPLPFDTMISGSFQIHSGTSIGAQFTVTDEVLGRPINTTPGGNIQVDLIEPNTQWNPYRKTLSLRFSKVFTRRDRFTAKAFMDSSNLFNRGDSIQRTNVYGVNWLRPVTIQGGRTLSFGVQTAF